MLRYIAFLDILGFSELIRRESLESVKHRLALALQSVSLATQQGTSPDLNKPDIKPPQCFSFSDTFVLASQDDTADSTFSFLKVAALLTQYLFAQSLPVRGSITFGEADYIPGTNHLVGKAITRAHELEKQQNWFGVIIDQETVPHDTIKAFESPILSPLYIRWDVPLKQNQTAMDAWVINWRLNLTIERGTRSLFPHSQRPEEQQKVQNTLNFARYLREEGKHSFSAYKATGERIRIPFLAGISVGPSAPEIMVHGDEL